MKEAVRYAYERYGLVPGPKDKNAISDIGVIREELRKLRDIRGATGFLYFLLEYCTMKHPTRGKVRMSEDVYRWQVDAAVEFLRNKFIISQKTRQTGFSSLTGAYTLWRTLLFPSQNCSILSLSQRESVTFLRERYKFVYLGLPDWLRQETGEFAKMSVTFEHNGSRFTSLPQGDDPARGDSLSMLIMDEFAMYKNAEDILASATPALSAGLSQDFTDSTLPAQMFIISTLPKHPYSRNGEENKYLELLHSAQSGLNEYKIIDVDVSDIPHYCDPAWHKRMLDTLGKRRYAIEVKGEEVYDTDNMVIPGYVYEHVRVEQPKRCDFMRADLVDASGLPINMDAVPFMKDDYDPKYGYVKGLWVWEDPTPDGEYIVVSDIATGRAGDFSTALVFDLQSNAQVAEYRGKVDTERLKAIIMSLCEMYNGAKLSVESTGLGGPVAEWFATGASYPGMYWHRYSRKSYKPGFPMSPSNKAQGIALMQTYLVKDLPLGQMVLRSQRLINEMRSFGYTKSGKVQALAGHDDLVMAFVQYVFLKHLGWATSDSEFIRNGIGTGAEDDEEDRPDGVVVAENAQREAVRKYWQTTGVAVDGDEEDSIMEMIRESGCQIGV